MATLISRANGNLTGSTAFAAIATGTGASQLTGTTSSEGNSDTTTSTFTITNGEVVDAVMLMFYRATATSGTMTVALRKNSVDQQTVTINVLDLPTKRTWVLFKLPSTVTGAGTSDYSVRVTFSGISGNVGRYYNSVSTDLNRALRTTTTATPNAADDLYIVGEVTQAAALTFTANTSPGSAVMTNVSSFTGLSVGQTVFSADDGVSRTISALDPGSSTVTTSTPWSNTRTGATYNIGATLTDLTVTMDQVASNTGVYQRTFTADATSGNATLSNASSTAGLGTGNPITGASFSSGVVINSTTSTTVATSGNPNATGNFTFTATTGYGAIHVGYRGTLTFGTTAATDYLLRVFGDLNVWSGGTLNIGTTGTPIPRTSTAVLEFGPATDGGYGLICNDGSTVNMQGLSRTSGKNVVACKAVGGRFTGNTVQTGTTISNVSDFTNVAVGQAIRSISTTTEAANTTSLPNTPLTIAAFDTGAGTITLSGAAVGTTTAALLATGPVAGATGFTVDTDTGWLSGDMIAIASTSRTASDSEAGKLTANAGASSLAANGFVAAATGQVFPLTGSGGLLQTHMGYPGIQAEIINLTRNVKVRSISPTLMTYVLLNALATADIDWTEFYYMGENATGKGGLVCNASSATSAKTIHHCAFHDCEDNGFVCANSAASLNVTFSNNVMWNCASTGGPAINLNGTITNNDWTISGNIIIRTLTGNGITLSDIGGTFTNNTVAGAASAGFSFSETSAVFGTFSGNVAHSNASQNFQFATGQSGAVSDTTSWRSSNTGLNLGAGLGLHLDGVVAFGNSSSNITLPSSGEITITDAVLNGDSSFSTTNGVAASSTGTCGTFTFNDCLFGVASGILVAMNGSDINVSALQSPKMFFNNCLFAGAIELTAQSNLSPRAIVASAKHDQVAGSHKFWKRGGTGQSDTTIYKTASPSERLTPAGNIVTAGITPFVSLSGTLGSVTHTVVAGIDRLEVGQWLYNSSSANGYVVSINSGAGTVDLSNAATSTFSASTFNIQPKLESSSRLVTVDSGGTRTVSVWVRKQQENLASVSQGDFGNDPWFENNGTITTGQADPLGGTSASRFVEQLGSTNQKGIARLSDITVVSGGAYTVSAYVKSYGGRQWIRFDEGNERITWFDIVNGAVGTTIASHTASITAAGDGFYRIGLTFTAIASSLDPKFYTASADNGNGGHTGDNTKGFLLFGVQVERGSSVSPYQATTTAISGYNGSQPRLVCKANPAVGLDTDTVIDTMSVAWGNWEMLTGTTPAPSGDKGVLELVVDCNGTTGFVNVDDWQVAA